MHFRKVSFKTVAFSSPEKLKKTKRNIFFQHPLERKKEKRKRGLEKRVEKEEGETEKEKRIEKQEANGEENIIKKEIK